MRDTVTVLWWNTTVVALVGGESHTTSIPAGGDLLLAFCDHPEMVLAREHLVELTTGKPSDGADRRIDILVSRIRAKLALGSGGMELLKTVRNGGYQLTVPVTLDGNA